MIKSLKTLLGLSLLGFFGVWTGCSSDSAPVAPYSASKAQDTSPTPGMTGVDLTEVSFTDNNLKYEVALAIFPAAIVPAKETFGTTAFTITRADLRGLEVLKASGKGIKSLSGLEFATNLDTLDLTNHLINNSLPPKASRNSITDLTPLAGLTNLEYLALARNFGIANVTPLAGLTNLEHLDLYGNLIRDVSSLASLTKLTHLGLGWNHEPLVGVSLLVANMPDLEWLKVNGIGLTDISFLEGLPKLEWLNLSANEKITDLSPIACLHKLEYLSVKRMRRGLIGNVADGFNVHIQYLIDKGVTVDALPQYGD